MTQALAAVAGVTHVGAALTARLEAGVDPADWDAWVPSRDRVLAAADRAVAAAGWGDRPLEERMAAKRRLLDHFDKAVR